MKREASMANKTYREVKQELYGLIDGSINELSPLLGVPNEQRSRLYAKAILKMTWAEAYVVYKRIAQAQRECRKTNDDYSYYSSDFNNVIGFIRDIKFAGFTRSNAEFCFAEQHFSCRARSESSTDYSGIQRISKHGILYGRLSNTF